ncbi:ubiquitin thioesterase zranb1-like [Plakobranchus ocellatus]|uniref:ubiquitinyl hydrolase 1 n=1 Tax=Plakobranchus ocellatus TaxID=259542 RepID=A0AAV3XZU2_9GAST|nr:ubiquitin thioesterase zranb1-like [Plakobranchus ocellatus]
MSNGGGSKWICEFCTYENYPAAKKCTMCFKYKTPQLISDTINEEQDIYKMAPLVSPSSPESNNSISSSSPDIGSKWACEVCTYLNWSKSNKCIQCLNPKRKPSPPTSRSHERIQSLSIKTSDICQGGSASATRLSPNSGSNNSMSKASNNGNRSSTSSPRITKWTCLMCTYENWPRSLKCVICGTPKERTSFSQPSSVQASRSQEIIPACTSNITSSSTTSPTSLHQRISPTSPTGRNSGDHSDPLASSNCGGSHQAGASASPHSLSRPNSRSSPSPPQAREKRIIMLRSKLRDSDWLWLNACMGAVDGDMEAIHAYIAGGGHPSRQLTVQEAELLNRPSAFQAGYTLVHLAIRFHREDMLAILLTATDASSKAAKRLPCMACPDLATDIRRQMFSSLRQRKGEFQCHFLTDCVTFYLPADIEDLSRHVQDQLFDEILDRDVQNELEVEEAIINWSMELTERLGSRLYALWNRTAGDCLLDSILQATWGVFDVDNSLRRALADSLRDGAMTFYPRWKEYESMQAESLHFTLDESQWQHDWAILLSLASQPGASLEQSHIFGLAHILRRPIIVYGVKYVKSFRGETLGFAKFQGVYLPLLWDSSFCWKNPVALGYTRGHFSALVPMEIDTDDGDMCGGAGANTQPIDEEEQTAFLPLVDCQGQLLQVHFLSGSEMGKEESVLKEWLHCHKTKGGLLVATQRLGRRPAAVKQMVDEWMDLYRQLQAQPSNTQGLKGNTFSSDGESDDE